MSNATMPSAIQLFGAMHVTASLLVASALGQTIWRVDDTPGPNVNFATIQEAIDAAVTGDVILVAPGSYPAFDLDKGLTVLGSGPALTYVGNNGSTSRVTNVAAGMTAIVAAIQFVANFELVGNTGIVVLDTCEDHYFASSSGFFGMTVMRGSRDVRMRNCALDAVVSPSSRSGPFTYVEMAECHSERFHLACSGFAASALEVLVTNPRGFGFPAGASPPPCFGGTHTYYDATPALYCASGRLTIAGRTSDFLSGGASFSGGCVPAYGSFAARFNGQHIRTSRVQFVTTEPGLFPNGLDIAAHSTHVIPPRADPTLRLIGVPRIGGAVTIALDGEPGDWGRLEVGRGPANLPSPGSPVRRLVTPGRALALGAVPATGTITLPLTIPQTARAGDVHWLQGSAVDPSGNGRRTNSVALIVRE